MEKRLLILISLILSRGFRKDMMICEALTMVSASNRQISFLFRGQPRSWLYLFKIGGLLTIILHFCLIARNEGTENLASSLKQNIRAVKSLFSLKKETFNLSVNTLSFGIILGFNRQYKFWGSIYVFSYSH